MHKIHAFVEMQENGSKLHHFFHQAEMNALLKDCEAGLAQGREFFLVIHSIRLNDNISLRSNVSQIETGSITTDISRMQHDAGQRHQEVLGTIEALSDTASSDRASTVRGFCLLMKHTNNHAADEQGLPRIEQGSAEEFKILCLRRTRPFHFKGVHSLDPLVSFLISTISKYYTSSTGAHVLLSRKILMWCLSYVQFRMTSLDTDRSCI
jgi:hypothetical protein